MKFTSAKSDDKEKITIVFETAGSGHMVGERAGIEGLADFLRSSDVQIGNIQGRDGLCSFDFTALQTHVNEALKDWPDTEHYTIIFVHPKQSS